MTRRLRDERERGETLAELLVTISIMGIAIVAITAALGGAIISSNVHRGRTTADGLARSAAECVKDRALPYRADGNYNATACKTSTNNFSTQWWTGASPFVFNSTQNANGLQQITVTATSGSGTETVTVLKRAT